jgi:hypothetical protein
MDLTALKQSGCIIFECISGSRAYGLATATSDTDIRGVYIAPKDQFYGLQHEEQINNETNDIVYYELRKFIDLLSRNNPNILEMLQMPAECILYKHPLFDEIKLADFLSKNCEKSFVQYAYTQIKKARGLNKKIVNPMEQVRKSVLDFCYVYEGKESTPVQAFLNKKQWDQSHCGLTAIPHLEQCYNLFYGPAGQYNGLIQKELANDVTLSSIPKGEQPAALLYFNKNAYSIYCKEYREYREWEQNRNEARYQNTVAHDKNYDAKNMMHTFRLLDMAREIATEGIIRVKRPNREFLLDIKHGKFEYDELVEQAEARKDELSRLFAAAALPDQPDMGRVHAVLMAVREGFYEECR